MGLIYDIATRLIGSKVDEVNNPDISNGIKENFGKMSAITTLAKRSVMSYPVIFSENVVANDEELMYAICRYLETQYALFTMTAMGINPIFEGTDASSHILKFYSEESDDVDFITGMEPVAEISLSDEKFPIKDDSDLQEYEKSSESQEKDTEKGEHISLKMSKLEAKARASDPTVVMVKLKMAKNTHVVEFPIMIKAMPRIITSDESTRIFTYLKEDKPLITLIRLMSGELKLFRDVIFQMERAKKDKELYAKLGRHPWFRQMMERRSNRKVNGLLQLIPEMHKWLLGNGNVNIMPICSLVVTKDEIEQGFGNIWSTIKKKDDNIMDKLMLLCLCVVDTTTSTVEFDFYGLKNNTLIKADSLISEGSNGKSSKDLEKLVQSLIYKV